jgi:hypothetical protein
VKKAKKGSAKKTKKAAKAAPESRRRPRKDCEKVPKIQTLKEALWPRIEEEVSYQAHRQGSEIDGQKAGKAAEDDAERRKPKKPQGEEEVKALTPNYSRQVERRVSAA